MSARSNGRVTRPGTGNEPGDPLVTLADIEAARERIRGGIYESPCVESIPLSQLTGAHVYCKLDYLQRTGSFKERGARNALLQLSPAQRTRGVIAASAGNHAQGVAYHGALLGIPVTVVMPKFASLIKVTNCRQLGATIILHGADLSEARAEAEAIAAREGLTFIHPYDNAHVIAGQGTIALEILEQAPSVQAIVAPSWRQFVTLSSDANFGMTTVTGMPSSAPWYATPCA